MADTPIETPLETARRIWPGPWEELRPPDTLALRAGTIARVSVLVYSVRPGDWVGSVDDRDVARSDDLAAVLTQVRDKVQAAVADLARAVGLEVNVGARLDGFPVGDAIERNGLRSPFNGGSA